MISKKRTAISLPTYEFIEDPIDDTTHIVITSGEAAGVVYRYGRVVFEENKIDDYLNIKFGYQVIRNPNQLTSDTILPIITEVLRDILHKEARG